MNRWKWFGSRPVLYFAEGDGGVSASGGGAGSGGGTASGAGAGGGAADTSALSDAEFLATPPEKTAETTTAIVPAEKEAAAAAEKTGEEAIVKLDALEEGRPQWFRRLKARRQQ